MVQIDVCIATYKRPQQLRKLLQSLAEQVTGGQFRMVMIVIDNDADGSAAEIAEAFQSGHLSLVYAVEPRQNIALARNKAFSLATGDFIATIDDDEYADPYWLLNLYQTMRDCNADVVMGPVARIFPPATPDYIRQHPLFNFPNPPTGSTGNFVLSTRSCLIRRAFIQDMAAPFHPDFGLTGGEDSVFFEHLKQRDSKLVWCREAKASEFISAKNAVYWGVLKRFFRNGHTTYLMLDKKLVSPGHPSMRQMRQNCFQMLVTNFAQIAALLGKSFHRSFRAASLNYMSHISFALGFLSSRLNLRYEIYKRKGL